MRRGTKKCILLLLAILLLCLLAWRLTPHTFEEMTASDRDEITSLAGVVSLSGVRDGRAYTESYALQNVTPEDTAFEGVLMLLNSTRYREDFRNHSVISAAACGVVAGFGVNSYRLAVSALLAQNA